MLKSVACLDALRSLKQGKSLFMSFGEISKLTFKNFGGVKMLAMLK